MKILMKTYHCYLCNKEVEEEICHACHQCLADLRLGRAVRNMPALSCLAYSGNDWMFSNKPDRISRICDTAEAAIEAAKNV